MIGAVPRLVHTPAVIQQCIIKHRDNFALTLQQTPQQNMTLEVCHRLTPLPIPWSLLVRLLHKSFVKKQYINRNMSYLSERQCQFCVDRAVASTERRPLGLLMHNARHRQKPIRKCVWMCARADFAICCTDGYITLRILEHLTSRNLTQHFVRLGTWRLVSFVFVIVVRHVP